MQACIIELLNKVMKSDKMRGLTFYFFFSTCFINSTMQEHEC